MDEAIDKIRYYLAHAQDRHELAAQQQRHFQEHHTFDRRMEELLHIIPLN